MHPLFVELFVEFLGTFFLVASILYSKGNWIIIGLTLGIAVLLGGKISGGCYNPAVTVASCMSKSIPYSRLIPYIIVQLLAAVLATLLYLNTKKLR